MSFKSSWFQLSKVTFIVSFIVFLSVSITSLSLLHFEYSSEASLSSSLLTSCACVFFLFCYHKMSSYREMGWSESSTDSDMDVQTLEDDMQEAVFSRARRGPIVEADPQILDENRNRWSRCLIRFLLDERFFSASRMQSICHSSLAFEEEFSDYCKTRSILYLSV